MRPGPPTMGRMCPESRPSPGAVSHTSSNRCSLTLSGGPGWEDCKLNVASKGVGRASKAMNACSPSHPLPAPRPPPPPPQLRLSHRNAWLASAKSVYTRDVHPLLPEAVQNWLGVEAPPSPPWPELHVCATSGPSSAEPDWKTLAATPWSGWCVREMQLCVVLALERRRLAGPARSGGQAGITPAATPQNKACS